MTFVHDADIHPHNNREGTPPLQVDEMPWPPPSARHAGPARRQGGAGMVEAHTDHPWPVQPERGLAVRAGAIMLWEVRGAPPTDG